MTKLMFEDTADLGDKIKAFTFTPSVNRNPCYIEGIVRDKGFLDKSYQCYEIKLTKKVWNGQDVTDKTKEQIWYVPFETDTDTEDLKVYLSFRTYRVTKKN